MPSKRSFHGLLGTAVLVAVVTTLSASPALAISGSHPVWGSTCDSEADWVGMNDEIDTLRFADGFEDGLHRNWSGGSVLPIGAAGQCSLGVTDGKTVSLRKNITASDAVIAGTLDVGAGGALRLATLNESNASVTLRNEGRANDRAVELVVRNATGAVEVRRSLSTRTGRFFHFRLRWLPDGNVRLRLGSIRTTAASVPDADVDTTTTPQHYRIELQADAYLDRIGVGQTANETADGSGREAKETDGKEDEFPGSDDTYGPGYDPDHEDRTDDGSSGFGGMGFLLLLFGLPGAVYPYEVARFGEQLDAIGSTTRAADVEPADWNVMLTRVIGVGMSLVGGIMLLSAMA